MISLLLPLIYISFVSLGLPDALLGAAWPTMCLEFDVPVSLAGVICTCLATARKSEKAAAITQAVTDTKLEALTREVRAHNNFAQRMPVVEEQIKVINHRLSDLEHIQ